MTGDEIEELASGEDAGLILSEDTLKQIELRKGETYILDVPKPLLCSFVALMCVRNPPEDPIREGGRGGGLTPHPFPIGPDEVLSRHRNGR